ncbi:hypothetical protein E5K00_18585 [Hymenobacter aquaticus]|uniref:Outer membrane protein beta-barrel domain-containing protein n=1 Tax=Hymenobacter aquaticus TaxID=1867101 RepID=A0A4Z0PXR5_9BACT|nr:outer membrane beta-barrel protein [Hymenobacter aquaticus]TGE22255.1 hypothetical protein E5K00_18585 [Hymenobacter aquaticus]
MRSSLRLLALPLLAISSGALAQTNFRPGYVVQPAGDTLRGEVDNRGAQYNGTISRFRPDAAATVVEYQPQQLAGYGFVSGQHYQALTLPGQVPTKAFLEVLALGQLSLYHYTDAAGKEHYYTRKGTEPLLPLVQRDTTVTRVNAQTGLPVTTKERQYPLRAVLWSQMADCPTAQVAVKSLELKESQLLKAVTAYNACQGGAATYARPARTSKTRFTALVLANRGQMDIERVGKDKVQSGWSAGGGLGLDFAPAFFNPKLTLQLQLLYTQHSFTKEQAVSDAQLVTGTDGRINYSIVQNTIQIPVLLRYTYPKGPVRPYLQAGPLLSLFTKNSADAVLTYKTYAGVAKTENSSLEMRSYGIGGTIGVGVAIPTAVGDFTLEARNDVTDALVHDDGISGKSGVSVVAGFTFGK